MVDHTAVPDQQNDAIAAASAGGARVADAEAAHAADPAHADPSTPPDYPLDETLELTSPAQYRALFEATRTEIVFLLLERAATTSELAEVLSKPKGTVGHHLKVLEEAGLVRVVRTKRVRALEAKYYGRTARVFLYNLVGEAADQPQRTLSTAAAEIASVRPDTELAATANIRYARIPAERAMEWQRRLEHLLLEFGQQPRGGEVTFAAVIGLYPTGRPRLPDDGPAESATDDEGSRDDAAP